FCLGVPSDTLERLAGDRIRRHAAPPVRTIRLGDVPAVLVQAREGHAGQTVILTAREPEVEPESMADARTGARPVNAGRKLRVWRRYMLSIQAASTPGQSSRRLKGAPSSRGSQHPPGFDAVVHSFDASAVVHTRSSSRR